MLVAAALTAGCERGAVEAAAERPAAPWAAEISRPPPGADPPEALAAVHAGPSLPASPVTFDVAALAERVKPFVVNIMTTEEPRPRAGPDADPFGLLPAPHRESARRTGLASGIIIDPAGYVITNEHVVRDTTALRVKLADGRELHARVVGRDPRLDIAVLRIEGASRLPVATLGSSGALRVGEPVLAVGNPFGLGHTVTLGIVSAKSRSIGAGPYDEFIQTDASINPGNSGGPLINGRGEVVGINSVVHASGSGIGFAIPSDAVKVVLPQLRQKGYVERGKLGVRIQSVTPELAVALRLGGPRGALVAEVEPGGAAARAGVIPGDVIVQIAGTRIDEAEQLARNVARNAPGATIGIAIVRGGARREIQAKLDRLEDEGAGPEGRSGGADPEPAGGREPLGIASSDAPDGGAHVDEILHQEAAGELEAGDVIVELNGAPVRNAGALRDLLGKLEPGSTVLLRIRREDRPMFVGVPIPARGARR